MDRLPGGGDPLAAVSLFWLQTNSGKDRRTQEGPGLRQSELVLITRKTPQVGRETEKSRMLVNLNHARSWESRRGPLTCASLCPCRGLPAA